MRDYTRDQYGGRGQVRLAMPALTPVVKWLLIINVAVFVASFMIRPLGSFVVKWFSVNPENMGTSLQIWRLITYQFLHGGIYHILMNMLVLFFFGPMLEKHWGSNKFLTFYLICGAMGGVLYTLLVVGGALAPIPLVGASGAIYGMLAAGAVLFPGMIVNLYGIFPLSMRTLAILFAVLSLLRFGASENAGGEAAHLAGMAAGVVYVLLPRWKKQAANRPRGPIKWDSAITQQGVFHVEIDRILDKVHKRGIGSLTRKEKNMLRQASKRQQQNGYYRFDD